MPLSLPVIVDPAVPDYSGVVVDQRAIVSASGKSRSLPPSINTSLVTAYCSGQDGDSGTLWCGPTGLDCSSSRAAASPTQAGGGAAVGTTLLVVNAKRGGRLALAGASPPQMPACDSLDRDVVRGLLYDLSVFGRKNARIDVILASASNVMCEIGAALMRPPSPASGIISHRNAASLPATRSSKRTVCFSAFSYAA
jgi:hypothetical protein